MSFSPKTAVLTVAASFYFLVIELTGGSQLAPTWFTEPLQAAGTALQFGAKLYLGASFGLLPANRGVVANGPYKWVRHPIYMGYLVSHVGFLLSAYSLFNLCAYVVLYALQTARIHEEEKTLSKDAAYGHYKAQVRYRLVPFLY